ncbi:hypothetical protein Hamer_G019027, partial [Homarus americanus]
MFCPMHHGTKAWFKFTIKVKMDVLKRYEKNERTAEIKHTLGLGESLYGLFVIVQRRSRRVPRFSYGENGTNVEYKDQTLNTRKYSRQFACDTSKGPEYFIFP